MPLLTLSQYVTQLHVAENQATLDAQSLALLVHVGTWLSYWCTEVGVTFRRVNEMLTAPTAADRQTEALYPALWRALHEFSFIGRQYKINPKTLPTPIMIKARFDRLAGEFNQRVIILPRASAGAGDTKQDLIRSIIPTSGAFSAIGVACTAAIVDVQGKRRNHKNVLNGALEIHFSGNHGDSQVYVVKKQKLELVKALPANNAAFVKAAKAQLGANPPYLLTAAHHAEDGWFAYCAHDLVTAALAQDLSKLPALSTVQKQLLTRPRIEFMLSCAPCSASGDPQEGCQAYFTRLRALVGAKIPIVIFTCKVWETSQSKNQVLTIDANGVMVAHALFWTP